MSHKTQKPTLDQLIDFATARPGLDFFNYGDASSYRQESRRIKTDLHNFLELMTACFRFVDNLEEALTDELVNSNRRLTLINGRLEYCTGQYYPTEYRPAACAVLVSVLWDARRKIYGDQFSANKFRDHLKRKLSTRVYRRYFQ